MNGPCREFTGYVAGWTGVLARAPEQAFLRLELLLQIRIGGDVLGGDFDGNRPIESCIPRLVQADVTLAQSWILRSIRLIRSSAAPPVET